MNVKVKLGQKTFSLVHLCVLGICVNFCMLAFFCVTGETADIKRFQILNNSNRVLVFELSWPAHCLTITPQHGAVEPE